MPDAWLMVVVLLVLGAGAWAVWTFNRLAALSVRAENAWSDIDVQLRKRWDLVPRLVETVVGYARHEREVLEEVTAARGRAAEAEGADERGEAESGLNRGVARLFALAEDYPALRADGLYRSLHDELIDVEDDLESARRYYNAVVRDLNTLAAQFPSSLVARASGRGERAFFRITDLKSAGVPIVRLSEGAS